MSRLSLSIKEDTVDRLNNCVPSGVRSTVVDQLISALCDQVDEAGPGVVGLILSGNCKLKIEIPDPNKI